MTETAIVTGASRGLGQITARYLVQNHWQVGLTARHNFTSDLPNSICVVADVADRESMTHCANVTRAQLGPARVVVCNAAVLGPIGRITDVDTNTFDTALRINVTGVLSTIAAYWSQLKEVGNGRIIVVSGGGAGGPRPLLRAPAYVPSKMAATALVELLAPECEQIGASIISIAPGSVIPTDFLVDVKSYLPDRAGDALINETALQQIAPDSAADGYIQLLGYLMGAKGKHFNGMLLSGKWNTSHQLDQLLESDASANLYRLRRIDNNLFHEA